MSSIFHFLLPFRFWQVNLRFSPLQSSLKDFACGKQVISLGNDIFQTLRRVLSKRESLHYLKGQPMALSANLTARCKPSVLSLSLLDDITLAAVLKVRILRDWRAWKYSNYYTTLEWRRTSAPTFLNWTWHEAKGKVNRVARRPVRAKEKNVV